MFGMVHVSCAFLSWWFPHGGWVWLQDNKNKNNNHNHNNHNNSNNSNNMQQRQQQQQQQQRPTSKAGVRSMGTWTPILLMVSCSIKEGVSRLLANLKEKKMCFSRVQTDGEKNI